MIDWENGGSSIPVGDGDFFLLSCGTLWVLSWSLRLGFVNAWRAQENTRERERQVPYKSPILLLVGVLARAPEKEKTKEDPIVGYQRWITWHSCQIILSYINSRR